ncbi:aspartyl/asparaginyl beta-hydroxylase domain-containing protein [Legionella cardiaca]|uniref:Aspartyl/asparaginyl beta-hydroxylase domain-containing protein n=1 Tax=Legionella cardiaca TaxID=1071983 RepID=A0ABY8ATI5_9GAMM|nr:aspartyl/asparaginyl beta-hydroxylase domain-containing protein [Legionella cardiaca]WED42820.1 aspartyl/asparaginyl beta-hydroxylase domain-containing protein [Legionella cardiaca]
MTFLIPLTLIALLFFCSEIERYRRKARFLSWYNLKKNPKSLISPINVLYGLISPNKPFLPLNVFPSHNMLAANFSLIQQEVHALLKQKFKLKDFGEIEKYSRKLAKEGWKSFFIKCYRDILPAAEIQLPKTAALIKQCPEINLAMLSIFEPGATIKPHYGPSKLCYRYHLCLFCCATHNAFINVDGQNYFWREGEAILFDDTYRHFAANPTQQLRVVLFCDIDRKLPFPFNYFNKLVIKLIGKTKAIKRMNLAANAFYHAEETS